MPEWPNSCMTHVFHQPGDWSKEFDHWILLKGVAPFCSSTVVLVLLDTRAPDNYLAPKPIIIIIIIIVGIGLHHESTANTE